MKHCDYIQISRNLGEFIKKSPTPFQAVENIRILLEEQGFERLREEESFDVKPGGRYYVTRNGSSVIALKTPESEGVPSLHITASHSDSPAFKLKEHALLEVKKKYVQLNTEGYGGMLCAPWFDRPLSMAGRVVVRGNKGFQSLLFDMDRDLFVIPNLAIHMNRKANEGISYNKQVDTLPLATAGEFTEEDFAALIAEELGVKPEDILGRELYLYNRMPYTIWGLKEEFISSPRLDDIQCAYSSLMAFMNAENKENINVYVCLDNEEVGSGTKQGAASDFLPNTLKRVFSSLGMGDEEYMRACSGGFMISCDNAHALHPNHPEKTDEKNCVFMNEGIVIKSHAGQKYTSDALSMAAFKELCTRAGVPMQYFANRSDEAGGSTLGNIAMSQVSMNCVDIGLPQLAMHSPYETAGVKDTSYMIDALTEFYRSSFRMKGEGFVL